MGRMRGVVAGRNVAGVVRGLAKRSLAKLGKVLESADGAKRKQQIPFAKLRAGSHRAFGPIRNDMGTAKRVAPGNRYSSKHRGDVAEMQFMTEAKMRGFGVSKPFGDNERYDLILDGGRRLWRVQVKSSASVHHNGFAVRACWRTSGKHLPYTAGQIDFMAVVIHTHRMRGRLIWYLIPVRALGGRLTINLYPFGGRRDCEMRLEKYREAWGLLERRGGRRDGRRAATADSLRQAQGRLSPGLRPDSE